MCDIEISKVTGNGLGLDSLTVIGNVQRCDPGLDREPLVIVQITCPLESVAFFGPELPFQGVVVDATSLFVGSNGDFFAEFDHVGDCRCGGQLLVSAHCTQDPACRAELLVDDLDCVACPRDLEFGDDATGVTPECESGATALVNLSMRFDDKGQPTMSFRIEPGHPDGEVVSEAVVLNPDGTRTVTAQIRYPTLSFPKPYVVAIDAAGDFFGCPPWPIEVGQIPACCPAAGITAEVDGCMVVANAEPVSVPHGCQYVWNFDASDTNDIQLEQSDQSQRVHHYDGPGTYLISVRVTCGSCNGEEATLEVEIDTECEESPKCQFARYVGAIAAALSLFALAMITCLPALWPALVAAAALFAITSAVIFYFYRKRCKARPCNQGLLSTAQAFLMAGFALVIYSSCCQTVLAAGFAMIFTGLGLLYLWRGRCGKTWCQYAAIAVGIVGGVLTIMGIVQSVPVVGDWFDQEWFGEVAGCLSTKALGWVSLVLGISTIGGSVCSAYDESDSTFI